jgi:hypothetical protein
MRVHQRNNIRKVAHPDQPSGREEKRSQTGEQKAEHYTKTSHDKPTKSGDLVRANTLEQLPNKEELEKVARMTPFGGAFSTPHLHVPVPLPTKRAMQHHPGFFFPATKDPPRFEKADNNRNKHRNPDLSRGRNDAAEWSIKQPGAPRYGRKG